MENTRLCVPLDDFGVLPVYESREERPILQSPHDLAACPRLFRLCRLLLGVLLHDPQLLAAHLDIQEPELARGPLHGAFFPRQFNLGLPAKDRRRAGLARLFQVYETIMLPLP
ncbi:MAG: hypothetical protein RBG13Loki_0858 [Promethearchaeota archaeon CR_4]|nr:MAG: hypothetical protein RBG13Loki_0858 [Candidatus Lokiarchaeota archaeon CR_4]